MARHFENLPAAIEQYEKCVQMDPSYAPAWARLGRARWLWEKYNANTDQGIRAADEAFQRAFRLNPNLALAHNFYTLLQVEQGGALDAMKRLLERAQRRRNDPEIFAALVHVCRYCGLLQPSVAAHQEARRLDPQIPTSVGHTYFMLGEYEQALEHCGGDFGFAAGMIMAAMGRVQEAIDVLHDKEGTQAGRLSKSFITMLRAHLEGNREQSLEAIEQLRQAAFRDPEGLYYVARQLARLGERDAALEMLSRAITHGYFCYPGMLRDPWLDSLRGQKEFIEILRKAQERHREAVKSFFNLDGDVLLGTPLEA